MHIIFLKGKPRKEKSHGFVPERRGQIFFYKENRRKEVTEHTLVRVLWQDKADGI